MNVFDYVAAWFSVPAVRWFRADPGWPALVEHLAAEQGRRDADEEERRAGIAWLEAFCDRRREVDVEVNALGGGHLSDAAHAVFSFTPGMELTDDLIARLHGPGGIPAKYGPALPLAGAPVSQTLADTPEPLNALEAI